MKTKTLLVLLCALCIIAHADNYDLVLLDGGNGNTNESGAYDLNNHGYVVGYEKQNGESKPFLWSPEGGSLELPKFSSPVTASAIAFGISDSFEVVGTYGRWSDMPYHISAGTAVTWVFDLETENFIPYSVASSPAMARDINNASEIAGQEIDYGFIRDIYNGTEYYSGKYSYCFAINNDGNATGMIYRDGMYSPYFLEKKNGAYQTVINYHFWGGASSGLGINDQNHVVGLGTSGGFYWEPQTGKLTSFGKDTVCYAIDNLDRIVGETNNIACIWSKQEDGSFKHIELNRLTSNPHVEFQKAFAINGKGQIAGQCLLTNGVKKAFLLTPSKQVAVALRNDETNGLVLSWRSVDSHNYSIHVSENLQEWIQVPALYKAEGTNSWVTIPSDQEKMFFKVFDLTP